MRVVYKITNLKRNTKVNLQPPPYKIYYQRKYYTYYDHRDNRKIKTKVFLSNIDISGQLPKPFKTTMKKIHNDTNHHNNYPCDNDIFPRWLIHTCNLCYLSNINLKILNVFFSFAPVV